MSSQRAVRPGAAPARPAKTISHRPPGPRRAGRLHHFFEATCDRMPDKVALEDAGRRMTYRELDERANRLAHLLIGLGIGRGNRVGIVLHRSAQTYVSLLAVLKTGAAFVPIDAGSPRDRVGYIVDDAGLDLLISTTELAAVTVDLACPVLSLDRLGAALTRCPATRPRIDEDGDPPCYVIYTSGSSGRPKGVEVAQSSICNFISVVPDVYDVRPTDRVYQGMTISFDFSMEEIWPTFAVGATLVVGPTDSRRLGSELADFLDDTGVTVFYCVPTLLSTVPRDLPKVRTLIVGGEACPAELVERWSAPGRRILNTYGPTEATVTATWGELRAGRPVTIGRPLPTYEVVLLDDDLAPVPAGAVGEICIGGPGVARGYVGRPDLTADRFVTHPLAPGGGRLYRTGDLGRLLDNGEIEYHGRADTQVKIRGYRVELTEIESVLAQVPGIAQAVVDTYEPTAGMVELVGYYSLSAGTASVDQKRIYDELRAHLPAYMVPAYLEPLAVVPMLPSGKADRKSLPPPKGPRSIGALRAYVAPTNRTEKLLADALAQVLRVELVSIDSHFFDDLGANSLLMAHFCARVRERPELPPVSIRDVYLHPTISSLAAALGDAAPAAASAAPAPRRPLTRVSTPRYLLCGALQLLLFLVAAYVSAVGVVAAFQWIWDADDLTSSYLRSVVVTELAFLALCVLPIVAKWTLVGRWKTQEIPIWSLRYLRFWLVKSLIRASPLRTFVGSPIYVLYLRALGAKIGPGVTIFSTSMPVCTDLLTIGAGTVIRKESNFSCYRARDGLIETGPVTLGKDVLIGENTVLDIGVSMGDGAQLGHASALYSSQAVPAGQRWHGSPAQPAEVDYRTVAPARCGTLRRFCYGTMQLLNRLVLAVPVALLVLNGLVARLPMLSRLVDSDEVDLAGWGFYLGLLAVSFVVFFGGLFIGLVAVLTVPRVLNLGIKPGKVYPLYGFHYWLQRTISRLTNTDVYMTLFGDSSYIVHYLRALGYRMPGLVQTGSNFGSSQRHESPYLSTIGTGTMVSDGLSLMNAEFSSTSFRATPVAVSSNSFFGNVIVYPAAAKLGDNCLLGTKTMVPIDGKIRRDVGLLGSPPFEIPRSVQRDSSFDHLKSGDEFRRRLSAKNRYNIATMGLFLFLRWIQFYVTMLIALVAADHLEDQFGDVWVATAMATIVVFGTGYSILIERAATGFRSLTPRFCSIYDPYFWRHERIWKLLAGDFVMLNGTPFKGLILRTLGVRVGARLFDDGCGIPEKTLVTIGRDCTLNSTTMIQCHSLEDGTFKSDRTTIGDGCTLGVSAFVHYGVTMGDGVLLDADSFLMKGEEVPAHARWGGNPARPAPETARVGLPTATLARPAPSVVAASGAAAPPRHSLPRERVRRAAGSTRKSAASTRKSAVPERQ
ncbi:Pls/PosA family non-ribosomal peptide synthetase [Planosporangium thailandense]|uniref:Pls/PosA family non-ribosomal peptide synthetase n=1 Tax=Planosporangium thailandense TaxID=765197 RepID=UPI00197C0960|nr:Pls/PosA family non-ribosomal peptide synthetase [Planosporangium thailandense]